MVRYTRKKRLIKHYKKRRTKYKKKRKTKRIRRKNKKRLSKRRKQSGGRLTDEEKAEALKSFADKKKHLEKKKEEIKKKSKLQKQKLKERLARRQKIKIFPKGEKENKDNISSCNTIISHALNVTQKAKYEKQKKILKAQPNKPIKFTFVENNNKLKLDEIETFKKNGKKWFEITKDNVEQIITDMNKNAENLAKTLGKKIDVIELSLLIFESEEILLEFIKKIMADDIKFPTISVNEYYIKNLISGHDQALKSARYMYIHEASYISVSRNYDVEIELKKKYKGNNEELEKQLRLRKKTLEMQRDKHIEHMIEYLKPDYKDVKKYYQDGFELKNQEGTKEFKITSLNITVV